MSTHGGGHKRAAYDHVLIVANELNLFVRD